MPMKKYIALAKIRFIDTINYRAETMLWQIIELIPILSMVFVWLAMNQKQVGGYSLAQIITYYFLSLVISRFISYHFSDYLAQQIRTGEISAYLMKPIQFIRIAFVDSFTRTMIRFGILFIPLLIALWLLFQSYWIIPQLSSVGWFILLIIMANLICFLLEMILLSLAFFFKSIDGLKHAQWMFESVLGGATIPLTFLPSWLQTISQWLPFKLLYYLPISVFLGQVNQEQIYLSLFQSLAWLLILGLLLLYLWKQGLKRYSAVGG